MNDDEILHVKTCEVQLTKCLEGNLSLHSHIKQGRLKINDVSIQLKKQKYKKGNKNKRRN